MCWLGDASNNGGNEKAAMSSTVATVESSSSDAVPPAQTSKASQSRSSTAAPGDYDSIAAADQNCTSENEKASKKRSREEAELLADVAAAQETK